MKWFHSMGLKACVVFGLTAINMHNSFAQQAPNASEAKTEVLWLGQAGFRIKTPSGQTIVIDPCSPVAPKLLRLIKLTSPITDCP